MAPRPVIFISAVSKELKSARQLVANTLQFLGYEPKWQDIVGLEQGDVRAILRRQIDGCAGLVQLVGQCYGLEPAAPDEQFGRVSFTQFEACYARQRGKKVWSLIIDETFAADPHEPEPDELRELQAAYRRRVSADRHLYHPLATAEALEAKVLKLRDELTHLRRRGKQWAALILALLLVCVGLGVWMLQKQDRSGKDIVEVKTIVTDLKKYVADPVNLRRRLEEQIEQSFKEKHTALLAAKAPYTEIDKLIRWHNYARIQIEESVTFIAARADDQQATIIRRATEILENSGVDKALEFFEETLRTENQRYKEERSHLAEKGRHLAEAFMMKAGLHESRFETAEQEQAIRDAIADAPDWWQPHNDLGFILQRRAEWKPAEQEYEAARKSMGADGEAIVLNNLAQLYKDTNRLAEAEPLMKRALKIDEKSYGPEHPKVAIDLNNLALLYQATNRLAEAEPLMERALKIDEKSYGPEHPEVATALSNLALLYQATNRLAEAEPLMERALKIAEKSFEPEHPDVATDLNNLATLYQATNRLAEAEPLMERALKIDEKSFGPEHPSVARDLNNLATLYLATNRLAEAEPLMERALKIDEKSYGPEHPDVARDLNNLALLYKHTNRLAEAEPLMERALKIDEKSYGPEHPNVAIRLNNLAQLYQATNRLAEAEPLMKRVTNIFGKSYGPEHPNVAASLNNLAALYQATNRLAEAETKERRALVILLKSTHAAGHVLPNLKDNIDNYKVILTKMSIPTAEVARRLAAAGREAGFTPEEFTALLKQLEP